MNGFSEKPWERMNNMVVYYLSGLAIAAGVAIIGLIFLIPKMKGK